MSDDQDTTAPGRVGWVDDVLAGLWVLLLATNIREAALEEMRVRAALKRAGMDENGMVHVGLNWWNEK